MKFRQNLIGIAILMFIMIIVIITAIVTMVIMAFKIHTLIGIFVLCAVIYYICKKLITII